MAEEDVAMIVVILNTSLSFKAETTTRITIAQIVAIPPQVFFMKP